ncbi:MAG TPA: hypothetical protein DCG47_12245 [Spirochaetaceae bacterium]|jgi:hypothetical protein|nr:hypothetical protein [Spirochaetaceae bacterium]
MNIQSTFFRKLFGVFLAMACIVAMAGMAACAPENAKPETELGSVRLGKVNELVPLVYGLPPQASNTQVASYVYKEGQRVDIYWPPDFKFDKSLPLVLIVVGLPDTRVRSLNGASAPDAAYYVSWSAAAATTGAAAAVMTVGQASSDFPDLVKFLQKQKKSLFIDPSKLFLFASSSNWAPVASLASKGGLLDGSIKGTSLYYASITDMTPIPNSGFPIEVVIAGQDNATELKRMESYIKKMEANGSVLNVVRYTEGRHAFDVFQDSDETRAIVANTLSFMSKCLLGTKAP